MARQLKHSKIKNTGILFELLTRQITADILNDTKSKSTSILKKYFNEKTELGKEKQLYEVLVSQNYSSESKANYLIDAVVGNRKKLQNAKLKREKYNLIKEIRDNYKVDDFFSARIPSYKLYASIYRLFLAESGPTVFDPARKIDDRYTIVEHLTSNVVKRVDTSAKKIAQFKKQDKDLRLLSYEILVERFNKKYSNLSNAQRNLLKEYINNISNTNSLKEFIVSESDKIKKQLKIFIPKVKNKITKIKLQEAIKQLDSVYKGRLVKDKQVVSLMRYYELIKELTHVCKT